MDRLSQLRGDAGGSGDSTLDTTSLPSEAYMSVNESSSKYFSFSDSTFDISPIKDVSLASTSADGDRTIADSDELLSNLSPIGKKDMLDNYKIGKQIEAANILSGGVDIFDDNDNSFDGNELVIDDNVELDDKLNPDTPDAAGDVNLEPQLALNVAEEDIELEPPLVDTEDEIEPELPLAEAEEIEVAPLLIDAEEEIEPEPLLVDAEEEIEPELPIVEAEPNEASREMEVVLQIDGNNVNAIDIGNGLYLYRKDGRQELAAIQIVEGDPQHSFKFLKVRDNAEGNLEVYEEIEVEVPKEVPTNEQKPIDKNTPHVPIIDTNKVTIDSSSTKEIAERKYISPQKEPVASTSRENYNEEKETSPESKTEVKHNGKMKFSELRKSPVVGCSFTPMTFHSTPNKEGKPLTKTMVDLQLDPNRHSDNVKKTIEVHTDNIKQKSAESVSKEKDLVENDKSTNAISIVKEVSIDTNLKITNKQEQLNEKIGHKLIPDKKKDCKQSLDTNTHESTKPKSDINTSKVTVANRLVTENQSTSTKSCESYQEAATIEVNADKIKDAGLDKKVDPVINKENDVVLSKADNFVLPESISRDTNDAAASNTAHESNLTTVISDQTMTDKSKTIDISPLLNNSKDIDKSTKCKKEMERSTVKTYTQLEKEKVKSITIEERVDNGKNNLSNTQQDKTASLNASEEFKLETSMKSNEDTKVPRVSDISSTSTNLRTEESKVKCVTPIVIHKDKRVPLMMAKTTTSKEDKESLSTKLSESIISNSPNEHSAIEIKEAEVSTPTVNESSSETNDQVDNTSKTADIAMSFSKSAEKPKNEAKSYNQKAKSTEVIVNQFNPTEENISEKILQPNPVLKVKLTEKPAVSISAVAVRPLEKAELSVPLPKVKPVEKIAVSISALGLKPAVNTKLTDLLPKVKPAEKTAVSISGHGVTLLEKIEPPVSVTTVKPLEKSAVSASALGLRTLDKTDASVPISKEISVENTSLLNLVSGVKPPLKTEMTIPVPKGKLSKILPHSTVLEFKTSKKETNPSAFAELKSSERTPHAISALNIKPSEKLVRIIPAPNVKPSEKAAQSTPLQIKPSEKATVSIKVVDVNPSQKMVHSTALPEVMLLENPSNTIIKIAKPDGHIPVVANIANKPSSKHIPILTILKTDGITKANDIIANPKEVTAKNNATDKMSTQMKIETREIKEPISKSSAEAKPVNNNHTAAVPFGKWTDVNRQEFLNKFKEVKVPVSTNSKQIKNSNDLNRRDVLKKIDSQRAQTIINNATAKAQEKLNAKNETVFSSNVASPKEEIQIPVKNEGADETPKQVANKITVKQENPQTTAVSSTVPSNSTTASIATKNEPTPRDLSTATMASLIDKTIEDMINRVVVPCKNVAEEPKQTIKENPTDPDSATKTPVSIPQVSKPEIEDSGSLDDIEMKMNELHGIPFVERPPHELPKVPIKPYSKFDKDKPSTKVTKIPNIISSDVEPKVVKDNVIDIDSEEELIEHEPITGDIELNKKTISSKLTIQEKKTLSDKSTPSVASKGSRKEAIITETDFDKFARRNSITYENSLTVNFEHREPHNVVQTVKERDLALKVNPKPETIRIEPKSKLPQKQTMRHNIHAGKAQSAPIFCDVVGSTSNKNYQSKIHSAYQSAMTAKHQVARPITIIEDKPVKVVFVESNAGFVPSQLNVQGQELSPAKKLDLDTTASTYTDSIDSDLLEIIDEIKQHDKTKTKHQRKQVLTPVEVPDLELIQPSDIGIEISPKKKRKIEDNKADKQTKHMVHKKSYLLGRNTITDDKTVSSQILAKEPPKEITNRNEEVVVERKDTASAIDSLVKAAELLENQTEMNVNISITPNPDSQPNTPVKRGRGRPRKYPLPEGPADSKTPSPQKKPKLIDAKPVKPESISDEPDDESSGEEMVRVNWTMGKINENIVCPICYKLFRSENVVFKHVKHCTGVSPNRSDSDKRSPRRARLSQESEDMDIDYEESETKKDSPRKRKSKEYTETDTKSELTKPAENKGDVIVIEDTLIKEKPQKHENQKTEDEPKKVAKARNQSNSLVCEFCGKSFRQLSYLVSHKFQHKKEQTCKIEKGAPDSNKSQVFNCEVCKKEFRKLHHLVQHRIIHNPDYAPKRQLRKSSSEQNDSKVKEDMVAKQTEDHSAAFRCEPCDKSFRKLHHLVEHRETHDGINRQKLVAPAQPTVEKPPPPAQCEICKKTFRKLHHLIEHKEQHADTGSEKSDDKSVKSSLSTRDIIHECSLCYMVFPNEHSLTKHSANCSKKKRQSKQPKDFSENGTVNEEEKTKTEDKKEEGEGAEIPNIIAEEKINDDEKIEKELDDKNVKISPETEKVLQAEKTIITEIKQAEDEKVTLIEVAEKQVQKEIQVKPTELQSAPAKRELTISDDDQIKETSAVPEKIKKIEHKEVKIQDTPKKKTPLKDKAAPTVKKRQKIIEAPLPAVENKPVESSDDDEVRYMLNPNYVQVDETMEGKTFMKVRANKRNSLQFERPKSNDLAKRRTSLQHPPKIPRPKPKAVEPKLKAAEPKPRAPEPKLKVVGTKTLSTALKHIPNLSEAEAALSTDSDDSDVKYSFPKVAPEKSKPAPEQTPKETEKTTPRKSLAEKRTPKEVKKVPRKSLAEKRKSLVGIAKRKSLVIAATAKHKVRNSPAKTIRKRTTEVEHRCDCGQLFSSAALLARHTSLAHTPPRIRRRRSPPPEPVPRKPPRVSGLASSTDRKLTRKSKGKGDATTSKAKPSAPIRKSSVKTDAAPTDSRKSSVRTDAAPTKTRKSSVKADATLPDTRKSSIKTDATQPDTRKSSIKTDATQPGTRKSSVRADATQLDTRKSSVKSDVTSPDTQKSSVRTDAAPTHTRKSSFKTDANQPDTRKSSVKSDATQPDTRKSNVKTNATPPDTQKSSVRAGAALAYTRKSSIKTDATPSDTRKSVKQNKSEVKASGAKTRRSAAHSGVPVPEKMRKLMEKAWCARLE